MLAFHGQHAFALATVIARRKMKLHMGKEQWEPPAWFCLGGKVLPFTTWDGRLLGRYMCPDVVSGTRVIGV